MHSVCIECRCKCFVPCLFPMVKTSVTMSRHRTEENLTQIVGNKRKGNQTQVIKIKGYLAQDILSVKGTVYRDELGWQWCHSIYHLKRERGAEISSCRALTR